MASRPFGVLGAEYLAAAVFPGLGELAHSHLLGLSYLGWMGFMIMWLLQAVVFWHGMESIKKFIDWAGPAVYAVMFLLAGWIVWKAGPANISLNLGEVKYSGWAAAGMMLTAVALVVSYFPGRC